MNDRNTIDINEKCDHCGRKIENPYYALSRSTEVLHIMCAHPDVIDEIETLSSECVAIYCDETCWKASEVGWKIRLRLLFPYPDLDDGLFINCSRCGALIDRSMPHVTYSVSDEILFESDGEFDAEVRTELFIYLAMFCTHCEAQAQETKACINRLNTPMSIE